jgi:hypothetical protein
MVFTFEGSRCDVAVYIFVGRILVKAAALASFNEVDSVVPDRVGRGVVGQGFDLVVQSIGNAVDVAFGDGFFDFGEAGKQDSFRGKVKHHGHGDQNKADDS